MLEFALKDLIDIVGGTPNYGVLPPLAGDASPVGDVVTDSRRVQEGDVFWGLVGPRHDGTDFADEAFARGAAGAVVSGKNIEPWAGRWTLNVSDTTWALWQLATVVRYRFRGRVIAVTGSVGKTTTRQLIHTLLGRYMQGSASPRNYNNHLGVPLSLLQLCENDDYAVIELGANRPGEIKALAELCDPHVGVVTCIAEAHLDGFGGQQLSIAESKSELLATLPDDGCAVVGGDDVWWDTLTAKCRSQVVRVGRSADCDLVATDVQSSDGRLRFRLQGQAFTIPIWGRHYLTSALAAIAVGQNMNLSMAEMASALEQFEPLPQRCEITCIDGTTIINDTYNACPTAMRAALDLVRDFDTRGRRIVVCGDMRELGREAVEQHRNLGDEVVTICGADLLVACGKYSREVVMGARDAGMPVGQAIACNSPREALPFLRQQLVPGDVVLLKGSRVMAMETILEGLQGQPRKRAA